MQSANSLVGVAVAGVVAGVGFLTVVEAVVAIVVVLLLQEAIFVPPCAFFMMAFMGVLDLAQEQRQAANFPH